jgi:choline monooxygenase
MYQSAVSFEAPLTPRTYFAEEALALESERVFESTWQLAGPAQLVSQPGQQMALEIGRIPVVIRNFDGQLVALKNVCTHRHSRLVSDRVGCSEKLKCPYHGWEFGADGRTRRIPAAKNFPDFDRDRYRLNSYSLEQCGDLLFVRTACEGPELREWLGDLFPKFEQWTSEPAWKLAVTRTLDAPANWKIPVEVSLESYHIPEVHPTSFGEDPGEGKSEHAFAAFSTSFYTSFNTPRWIDRLLKAYEQFIMWMLGTKFTGKYEHHHVFPNLLISHTDSLTLVQVVRPTSPQTSRSEVWQYGRQSRRGNPFSRMTASLWAKFTGLLSWQILKEDLRIFRSVQTGEQAASDHAILGRCEERLYAFQKFLEERVRR